MKETIFSTGAESSQGVIAYAQKEILVPHALLVVKILSISRDKPGQSQNNRGCNRGMINPGSL